MSIINKVRPGTTVQLVLDSIGPGPTGDEITEAGQWMWTIYYRPGEFNQGTVSVSHLDATYFKRFDISPNFNYGDNHGWDLTQDGLLTIPSNIVYAPYAPYSAYFWYYVGGPQVAQSNIFYFDVMCLTVKVTVAQLTTVPGASPGDYVHTFLVQGVVAGGTAPFSYSWSTTVSGGSIGSANGNSAILTVTNTTPNFSGITGTVTCSVADSNSPPCTDSDTADIANARPPVEGPMPTCNATGFAPGSGGLLGVSGGLGMMALPLTGARSFGSPLGGLSTNLWTTRQFGNSPVGTHVNRGMIAGGYGATRGTIAGGRGETRGGFYQTQGGPSGSFGKAGMGGSGLTPFGGAGGGSGLSLFDSMGGGGGGSCSSCTCGSGTDLTPGEGFPGDDSSWLNTPDLDTPFSWCVQPTGNNVVASAGSSPAGYGSYGSPPKVLP